MEDIGALSSSGLEPRTYPNMISRQQRFENVTNKTGTVKLVCPRHLNVLRLAKIGYNHPWFAKRAHEHLDHR
jgi:hypothetical protein